MQSAQAYSASLEKRKKDLGRRLAALATNPCRRQLERELTNIDEELAKQSDLILAKQQEIAVVNARYDADKLRWQQLRVVADNEAAAAAAAVPTAGRTTTSARRERQEVIADSRSTGGAARAALVIFGVRAPEASALR